LKVLYTMAFDPLRLYYQREIANEANISVGSANRVLPDLVRNGLVTKEEKGKIHIYRYNIDDPAARQLKVLFNVLELKEMVEGIKPHAKRVIMFGSCSGGTDVKDSDVDLFILTDEKNVVAEKVRSFSIRRLISPIIVDANDYVNLRNQDRPLYDEVLRGIKLWERE
jgi:predicted nucleotidyltransferase